MEAKSLKEGEGRAEKKFLFKQMLPKKNRLKNKADFSQIFKSGKTVSQKSGRINLRFFKSGSNKPKIGIVVGKNCFAKATERNKIKRLLREAFKKNLHLIDSGWNIAVYYKKNKQKKFPKFNELVKEMKELINEARLIKTIKK